jgi:hypothetical protein
MSALDLDKYNDEGLRQRIINIFHDVMADFGQSARDNRFGGALSDMELFDLVRNKVLEKVKKLKKPKAKDIQKRCVDIPLRDKKGKIMKDNKGKIIKKQECGPKYEKSSEQVKHEQLANQLRYQTPHGIHKTEKGYDYKKQKGKLNKLHKDKHPFTYQMPIDWQKKFQEEYHPQEFVDADYQDNPEELDAQELKKMRDIMGDELRTEQLEQSGVPDAPPMDPERTFVDELKERFKGDNKKTQLKPIKHLDKKVVKKTGYSAVMEELMSKIKKRGGGKKAGDMVSSIIGHAMSRALNPSKLLKYIPDIAKLISAKKGGAKKKPSDWIKYVKEYKKLNKIASYSQALKEASKHYKK